MRKKSYDNKFIVLYFNVLQMRISYAQVHTIIKLQVLTK